MAYAQASYPPSISPSNHYANTVSTVHRDRPIRPLPKRRLKKISDTRAGLEASAPASTAPTKLFQLPFYAAPVLSSRSSSQNSSMVAEPGDGSDPDSPEDRKARMNGPPRPEGADAGSKKSTISNDGRHQPSHSQKTGAGDHRENSWNATPNDPQSLASSADSVDGYDSFENTNNKKKRKIPTNGGHHSSLSTEMAAMGLPSGRELGSPPADVDGGVSHYYGSGSSAVPTKAGTGLSGAGRGRIGRGSTRRRSNRSPLGVSTNGGNLALPNYSTVAELSAKENLSPLHNEQEILTNSNLSHDQPSQSSAKQEAIAAGPQSSSKSTSNGKTQFTFTCESDSAKSISWPDYGYPPLPGAYPDAMPNGMDGSYDSVTTPGTQDMAGYGPSGNTSTNRRSTTASGQPRRTKRSLAKQYASAAKERKVRQAYGNFHHPPKVEDVWICEYCEYEAIFGSPPEALIRQYEIKDRRERRRLAEKQRLLEKAKMRNKRGKKGGKNSKNAQAATQAQQQQQQTQKPRHDQLPGEFPQDAAELPPDEYLLDDYDEDPISTPILPPKALSHASSQQRNAHHSDKQAGHAENSHAMGQAAAG